MVVASLFIYAIHGAHEARFLFISFPLFIPLCLMGLSKFVDSFYRGQYNSKIFLILLLFLISLNHIVFKDNIEFFIGDLGKGI